MFKLITHIQLIFLYLFIYLLIIFKSYSSSISAVFDFYTRAIMTFPNISIFTITSRFTTGNTICILSIKTSCDARRATWYEFFVRTTSRVQKINNGLNILQTYLGKNDFLAISSSFFCEKICLKKFTHFPFFVLQKNLIRFIFLQLSSTLFL